VMQVSAPPGVSELFDPVCLAGCLEVLAIVLSLTGSKRRRRKQPSHVLLHGWMKEKAKKEVKPITSTFRREGGVNVLQRLSHKRRAAGFGTSSLDVVQASSEDEETCEGEEQMARWVTMATAPETPEMITQESIPSELEQSSSQCPEDKVLRRTVKEITAAFVRNTKFHGLRYVFARDRSKARRLFWLLAFFSCVGLLSTWSWNRLHYLLSYPAVTKIHMVWARSMSFPAVTLCNQNLFRMSSLTKDDLYHSGYWLDLLHVNHSVNRRTLSTLRDDRKQSLLSLLDFSQYAPPPRFNTTEMVDRLGHQLEDMLLECKFQGENCTYKNFTPQLCFTKLPASVSSLNTLTTTNQSNSNGIKQSIFDCSDPTKENLEAEHLGIHENTLIMNCSRFSSQVYTRYGKCYTFNSGLDGNPLLTTLKGGTGNGLEIMLDIQQDEYLPVWGETDETSYEAGVKVQIHSQVEPPFVHELGFGVAPGFQTFVSTQEQRVAYDSCEPGLAACCRSTALQYLPPPWGDCKSTPIDSEFFSTYSITACRIDCETRYLVENCNCRMVHMPGTSSVCTPEQYKDCADPALDFLVEKDNNYCVCETPCNMTRYGKELSMVKIPSKASAKYLAKKFNKTEQYIADNILVLDIFFEALNYEKIEQKKAYEVAGLLGDIGGQMGLFIGASVLTILEIFDYLYEVFKDKVLGFFIRKKRPRRCQSDNLSTCDTLRSHSDSLGFTPNMLPRHPTLGNFEEFAC
ncbi:acid-sensing ion channel 3-like, partial [Scleropages formosus]